MHFLYFVTIKIKLFIIVRLNLINIKLSELKKMGPKLNVYKTVTWVLNSLE